MDGDGIEEQIELVDLKYNGGDGGYALRVTDTKTNEQIPLPDSYREENGFPIFGTYVESDSEKPRLLIQLGEGKQYQTVATIMMDALDLIYDRNLAEFKNVIQNKTSGEKIMADAISGCNVITFQNEETPVVFLKTYVSGFWGMRIHWDMLSQNFGFRKTIHGHLGIIFCWIAAVRQCGLIRRLERPQKGMVL